MDIQEISSALTAMPPRFHVGVGQHDEGVSVADLLTDTAKTREWLDADAPLVGAPNDQVTASMLVQHTAMVLGGSMMAAALLHGSLPIADPSEVTVVPGTGGPRATRWRFFVAPTAVEHGTPEELLPRWAEVWVDGILFPIVDALCGTVRVGKRMLVDNVASAGAANLVFLDWWSPQADLGRLAPAIELAGTPTIGESVTFTTIEHGTRVGLRSSRRSCCLHFQCEPAHWCPTCPKLEAPEQEQIMRTHLGHLDAVVAQRAQLTPS